MKRKITTETMGGRLRSERERLGLTQVAFAELGGVRRVTQHLYETDKRSPDADYLNKIADIGCDISYVLRGNRSPGFCHDALRNIFRLVDQLGRNSDGELKSVTEREDLFAALCIREFGSGIEPPSSGQIDPFSPHVRP